MINFNNTNYTNEKINSIKETYEEISKKGISADDIYIFAQLNEYFEGLEPNDIYLAFNYCLDLFNMCPDMSIDLLAFFVHDEWELIKKRYDDLAFKRYILDKAIQALDL